MCDQHLCVSQIEGELWPPLATGDAAMVAKDTTIATIVNQAMDKLVVLWAQPTYFFSEQTIDILILKSFQIKSMAHLASPQFNRRYFLKLFVRQNENRQNNGK